MEFQGPLYYRLYTAVPALLVAFLSSEAGGAGIRSAYYDGTRDELVVEIAYRGTVPDHDFSLQWGECRRNEGKPHGVVARLIDLQGKDAARKDFRTRARFSLDQLECRPAQVTLRLGRISHQAVLVPAAPERH